MAQGLNTRVERRTRARKPTLPRHDTLAAEISLIRDTPRTVLMGLRTPKVDRTAAIADFHGTFVRGIRA